MLVILSGITVFLQPVINVFVDVSIIALQLFRESYTVFPDSTTIDVKPLQKAKAASPMLVTLLGIVMLVKPLQLEKADPPMLVTLLGIVMLVKTLQS